MCGSQTFQDLDAEIQAACQESNSSVDPNHFKNKRATSVDWWPKRDHQRGLVAFDDTST
jgi:hypothetical protein